MMHSGLESSNVYFWSQHLEKRMTLNEFADNPYEASTALARDGMTLAEKIYTAIAFIAAGLLLLSLAAFHFLIIPGSENPSVFYFVVATLWLAFLTIMLTNIANVRGRCLRVIPTVIQCVLFALMVYLIPVAIFGGVLLYQRSKQDKAIK